MSIKTHYELKREEKGELGAFLWVVSQGFIPGIIGFIIAFVVNQNILNALGVGLLGMIITIGTMYAAVWVYPNSN